jgi:hypothetical protein
MIIKSPWLTEERDTIASAQKRGFSTRAAIYPNAVIGGFQKNRNGNGSDCSRRIVSWPWAQVMKSNNTYELFPEAALGVWELGCRLLMPDQNPLSRLRRDFYDDETHDRTLSVIRDLYFSLLIFLASFVFRLAVHWASFSGGP